MEDQKEVWKTIKDFPRYQISNLGRVKSLIGHEKILNPSITKKGYLIIEISQKPVIKGQYRKKKFRLHRLVAQHFCEGYSEKKEVHHRNLQRDDNKAVNLICLTRKDHLDLHKKIREEIKRSDEDQQQIGENNGISSSSELENNKS